MGGRVGLALKTFNLDKEVYKQFSDHCKKNGVSMSKKVENFIKQELEKINSPEIASHSNKETHPMHKYC
ncbi:hypothetical protein J4233_00665 [Candidatus Pacearchaeota archaeon]|nr:hypothetical protein [Candidatus Pacearchaeota archaeon]